MAVPRALYVHIPFCLSVCPYCDFVVLAGRAARGPASRVAETVRALHVELDLRADALAAAGVEAAPLASVYLGGGTPSLLSAEQIDGLLDHAARRFGLAAAAEVTIEVNPGPADRGDLAGFRAAGVNRVSIGAQSLDAEVLAQLGRRHRPEDVADTVAAARAAGLANVSVDLLYDVPGQTVESWLRTLTGAVELDPTHVSAYALTLDDPEAEGLTGPVGDHLPVTPGARKWRSRARDGQDEDRAADEYATACASLAAAGYRHYELSNWARPGSESRHNLAYWRRDAHEALGPGAHAFDGVSVRRWNAARLDAYLAALLPAEGVAPCLPPGGTDRIDAETARSEAAILGLRLDDGITAESAAEPVVAAGIAWALAAGLADRIEREGPRIALTPRGRLLSNEVFVRLLPDADAV